VRPWTRARGRHRPRPPESRSDSRIGTPTPISQRWTPRPTPSHTRSATPAALHGWCARRWRVLRGWLAGSALAGSALAACALLVAVLPHALPELVALFLPLAAWIVASRRRQWDQLLAATLLTVAIALPLLLASAIVETYLSPHLFAALTGVRFPYTGRWEGFTLAVGHR
jgi:hypothetical protein